MDERLKNEECCTIQKQITINAILQILIDREIVTKDELQNYINRETYKMKNRFQLDSEEIEKLGQEIINNIETK